MSQFESIHALAKTVPSGTVLFQEGTAGGGIIVLLSGRLKVLKGEHHVGTISEPGSYVGESTFVTGRLRSATVVAENSATIIRLSAQQSADFLQTREAEAKMMRTVTERLNSANKVITERATEVDVLRDALQHMLVKLAEIQKELVVSADNPAVVDEATRRIRVLVNQYGTAEYVERPVVI